MTPTTQAVILARGLGTRMRRDDGAALSDAQQAAAATGAKGMMTIEGGRPFLDYVVSALADAGIAEVVLVVAADHATIRDHYDRSPPERVVLRYAVQDQPRGTADAVYAARDAIRNAPFLVLNADNYYSPATLGAAAGIGACGLVAFEADTLVRLGGFEPERVLRFALLDIAPDDTLRAVREKPAPDDPLARTGERWVSMNLWSFTPEIFEACMRVRPSSRGELELQDAVTVAMRDLGVRFRVVRVRDGVLDLSHRADVARVAARLAGMEPRP
ncbi:MAG: sugar phosphate nucleotidyltransferase [Gemmatimonadota bacterium]|nr:sugar phosphate nucleotidyltransferase [Gemmatimonadota bacterium]